MNLPIDLSTAVAPIADVSTATTVNEIEQKATPVVDGILIDVAPVDSGVVVADATSYELTGVVEILTPEITLEDAAAGATM